MSASPISASVGVGGANRKPDVLMIQRMLNAVPLSRGGPSPQLGADGLCGPKTCGAISRFQQMNLGKSDGKIDPGFQTLAKLIEILTSLGLLGQFIPGSPGAPTPAPAPGVPAATSQLRSQIVKWAKLASTGPYQDVGGGAQHGIVSDYDTTMEVVPGGGQRTVRRGWKNYKEFFDVAVAGWSENHWKAPGYLDGVKIPGRRVPKIPGQPGGISWCGIFATWCWIKAGKNTKWVAGIGPTNATRVAGKEGIQPGDICVQYGGEVHHFIATGVQGNTIEAIHGNSIAQSILSKPVDRNTINYYYRPE